MIDHFLVRMFRTMTKRLALEAPVEKDAKNSANEGTRKSAITRVSKVLSKCGKGWTTMIIVSVE